MLTRSKYTFIGGTSSIMSTPGLYTQVQPLVPSLWIAFLREYGLRGSGIDHQRRILRRSVREEVEAAGGKAMPKEKAVAG